MSTQPRSAAGRPQRLAWVGFPAPPEDWPRTSVSSLWCTFRVAQLTHVYSVNNSLFILLHTPSPTRVTLPRGVGAVSSLVAPPRAPARGARGVATMVQRGAEHLSPRHCSEQSGCYLRQRPARRRVRALHAWGWAAAARLSCGRAGVPPCRCSHTHCGQAPPPRPPPLPQPPPSPRPHGPLPPVPPPPPRCRGPAACRRGLH